MPTDDPMLKFLEQVAGEVGWTADEIREVRVTKKGQYHYQISLLKEPRSAMIYTTIQRSLDKE